MFDIRCSPKTPTPPSRELSPRQSSPREPHRGNHLRPRRDHQRFGRGSEFPNGVLDWQGPSKRRRPNPLAIKARFDGDRVNPESRCDEFSGLAPNFRIRHPHMPTILSIHSGEHLLEALFQNLHRDQQATCELIRLPFNLILAAVVVVQPIQQVVTGGNRGGREQFAVQIEMSQFVRNGES